ncbi:MAG: hypothetical protein ACI8P3_004419 [Saprospiraceae bacterium]|jgi:hypothetical protein
MQVIVKSTELQMYENEVIEGKFWLSTEGVKLGHNYFEFNIQ